MTSLLSDRIWYFAVKAKHWKDASNRKAKEEVLCVKSGIGKAHGKLRSFLRNSPMRLRQAKKQDHNEMRIAVVPIHLEFTLHRRNIYICVVAIPYIRAMQTGSENRSAGALASKRGLQRDIVDHRMGYCMKRIEVDLKCMRSINRDQNSRMEGRREEKKKKKFARGDERDVGWLCVNVGRTRSTGKPAALVIACCQMQSWALTAAKTQFRYLFCPSPRSYCHYFRAPRSQRMKHLPRMDCVGVQRSPAGTPQSHRKKGELLARAGLWHFGRPRPKCQYTVGNDPAARGRTAHPCPVDDPTNQTETSATGAVAAVVVEVVAANAAVTGTGNQLQTVVGTSQKNDCQLLPRNRCRPRVDLRWGSRYSFDPAQSPVHLTLLRPFARRPLRSLKVGETGVQAQSSVPAGSASRAAANLLCQIPQRALPVVAETRVAGMAVLW